jgi:antitoxin CptB
MPDPVDVRRRRALYRATHRGTKEMDWLLGRYADAILPQLGDRELAEFERLLTVPDSDLHGWLIDPRTLTESAFAAEIDAIRRFHKLAGP